MAIHGVAPISANRCTMTPDQSLTFVDEELEWAMMRVQAHIGGLAGLVNVCAAINQNVAPIVEVRIK